MENNKNKKSVKFQGDMLNYCDFIQVFVFTSYHHLKVKAYCHVLGNRVAAEVVNNIAERYHHKLNLRQDGLF